MFNLNYIWIEDTHKQMLGEVQGKETFWDYIKILKFVFVYIHRWGQLRNSYFKK